MSSVWKELAVPHVLQTLLIFVGMAGLQSLVAVWAATSRQHWFLRALGLWLAVSLLIPIQAWEPAWVFATSSPLIVGLVLFGKRIFQPRNNAPTDVTEKRWRFSLLDLLLVMALAALSIHSIQAIVRSYQPGNWLGWLVSSVAISVLAVIAFACAGPPRQGLFAYLLALALLEVIVAYWLDLPVFTALSAATAILAYLHAFRRRHWWSVLAASIAIPGCALSVSLAGVWMRSYMDFSFSGRAIGHLVVIGSALTIWLTAVIALSQALIDQKVRFAWRAAAGLVATVLVLFVAVPVGQVYWNMLKNVPHVQPIAIRDTPGNNFARIAELAHEIELADPTPITYRQNPGSYYSVEIWRTVPASPELQARYEELLALLAGPCSIPFDPNRDATPAFEALNLRLVQSWRMAVHSLQAEARLAQQNEEPDVAARLALGMIRLADMQCRGGLDYNVLLGTVFRRIGYVHLCEVRDELSPDCLREVLAALHDSVAQRDPIADVSARQVHYERQLYGWHQYFQHAMLGGAGPTTSDQLLGTFHELDLTANCLLRADLAIRLYQLERGRLPGDLQDLVPEFLAAPILDPYSQPLRYQPSGETFLLYSIGCDGRDDGGRFTTLNEYSITLPVYAAPATVPGLSRPTYDFDLGTLTREPPD